MKYIKEAIEIFFERKNMIYFFKVYSVALFLSLLSFVFGYTATRLGYSGDLKSLAIIPPIILFPISVWSQASGYEAVKRVVSGGGLEFRDTYKTSRKYLWKFFLANLMLGLIIIGGLILLIIPGIIFSLWYAFTIWGVVDRGYGIRQALSESKKLVKGRFWRIAGQLSLLILFVIVIQIVFSLIPRVGPLTITIFGGLFLLPYYLLYRELASGRNS